MKILFWFTKTLRKQKMVKSSKIDSLIFLVFLIWNLGELIIKQHLKTTTNKKVALTIHKRWIQSFVEFKSKCLKFILLLLLARQLQCKNHLYIISTFIEREFKGWLLVPRLILPASIYYNFLGQHDLNERKMVKNEKTTIEEPMLFSSNHNVLTICK